MSDLGGSFSVVAIASLFIAIISISELVSSDALLPDPDTSDTVFVGFFLFVLQTIQDSPDASRARQLINERYGPRGPYTVAKSNALRVILDMGSYNERMFRQMLRYAPSRLKFQLRTSCSHLFRCSRRSFYAIDALIHNHPVFQSHGKKPQRNPRDQLAVFLTHVSSPAHHTLATALDTDAAQGSVFNYVTRVTEAIRSLRRTFVRWPEGERRAEVKAAFGEKGFPDALGVVDGCLIHLVDIPHEHGMNYWTRKKFPGVSIPYNREYRLILIWHLQLSVLAVCDHELCFIYWHCGAPGSQNDVTVYKASTLCTEQHRFVNLTNREYILSDKGTRFSRSSNGITPLILCTGYPIGPGMMRPYDKRELRDPETKHVRSKWNKEFSGARIPIEHAFGRWKGRFPILKYMSGHDIRRLWALIEALMILHNIFIFLNDNAEDIPHYNPKDEIEAAIDEALRATRAEGDADDLPAPHEPRDAVRLAGLVRREELMEHFKIRRNL